MTPKFERKAEDIEMNMTSNAYQILCTFWLVFLIHPPIGSSSFVRNFFLVLSRSHWNANYIRNRSPREHEEPAHPEHYLDGEVKKGRPARLLMSKIGSSSISF